MCIVSLFEQTQPTVLNPYRLSYLEMQLTQLNLGTFYFSQTQLGHSQTPPAYKFKIQKLSIYFFNYMYILEIQKTS